MAALGDRDPVVLVAPSDRRVREDLDSRSRAGGRQFVSCGPVVVRAPQQMSAELMFVLDEHHRRSGLRSGERRSHARRTTAGNDDIRMGVTLVVATVRCVEVDTAARGEFRQDVFVGRPQFRRLHEGLVVEAGGEEAADEAVGGFHVELQRRPHVLRRHGHAVRKLAMRGTHVRLVVDLHGRVGIPEVGGQHAAGPVVFHGTAEDVFAVGQERRGDGVALETLELLAVPGERDHRRTIDDITQRRGKSVTHFMSP